MKYNEDNFKVTKKHIPLFEIKLFGHLLGLYQLEEKWERIK